MKKVTPVPPPDPTGESGGEKNSLLSTTKWLMLGSIVVSLAGLYYKNEGLKAKANAQLPVDLGFFYSRTILQMQLMKSLLNATPEG